MEDTLAVCEPAVLREGRDLSLKEGDDWVFCFIARGEVEEGVNIGSLTSGRSVESQRCTSYEQNELLL